MKRQGVDFYYSLIETNYIHQTEPGYVPSFEQNESEDKEIIKKVQ